MSKLLLGVMLFLVATNASASIITWQVADGGNGNAYEFVDEFLIWTEAKAAAELRTYLGVQGHLVTLTSAEENEFVFDFILPVDAQEVGAWIGLTDDEAYGGYESFGQPNPQIDGWFWVTGETVAFTAWNSFSAEPNNSENEDYAVLHGFRGKVWNDQTSHYAPRYIVEYEVGAIPEPCTLAIWSLLGGIGLFVSPWRKLKRAA